MSNEYLDWLADNLIDPEEKEQSKDLNNKTNVTNKKVLINSNKGTYSIDEICPVCGRYQPDGQLCIPCQKEYDMYKPRVDYGEI